MIIVAHLSPAPARRRPAAAAPQGLGRAGLLLRGPGCRLRADIEMTRMPLGHRARYDRAGDLSPIPAESKPIAASLARRSSQVPSLRLSHSSSFDRPSPSKPAEYRVSQIRLQTIVTARSSSTIQVQPPAQAQSADSELEPEP